MDAVPITVAFSGFTSPGFILLFVMFALVALVTNADCFSASPSPACAWCRPPTVATWALAVSGLLVTPLIPGSAGRLTLVSPLVLAIKDTLRLADRGRAAAGLAMAATMGFSQMSFLFLNGSGTTLLVASLLPTTRAARSPGCGAAAAWPLGLLDSSRGCRAARRFGPRSALWVDQRVIEAQLRTLCTITRQEFLGLVGLALILLAFVLQPWSRMDPAWLGLIILSLLALSGADRTMFKELDYQYLLYFALFQSIAAMIREAGV